MGDNITPPQQAFNWIADVYSSTEEIKANGQTIVGLLHEDVGHLGIFVSGKVAKKEHAQIVEVLKYIQQLPPGLYGMDIEEHFDARRRSQLRSDAEGAQGRGPARAAEIRSRRRKAVRGGRRAVRTARARLLAARAAVRARDVARVAGQGARELASAARAVLGVLGQESVAVAAAVRWPAWCSANRKPRAAGQRFGEAREVRVRTRSARRSTCIASCATPRRRPRSSRSTATCCRCTWPTSARRSGASRKFDPRSLPAVREVLDTIEEGSAVEGLARIAMLITKAGRGQRRLSQMQRTREILSPEGDIAHLSEDERRRLLQEETIVVEFEPERAKRSLPEAAAHARANAGMRWRCSTASKRTATWTTSSASWWSSCAGCCRCRGARWRPSARGAAAAATQGPHARGAARSRRSAPRDARASAAATASRLAQRLDRGALRAAHAAGGRMAAMNAHTRIEKDALGEVPVPASRLWGAQTQRSIDNFPIGVGALRLGAAGHPRVRHRQAVRGARQWRAGPDCRRTRRT